MRIIKCTCCGKEFQAQYPNQKYCGLRCANKGRLEHRSEWIKNHPGYIQDLKRRKADKEDR